MFWSAGFAQGLAAGLSPGPFLALVLTEGLRRGPRAAALVVTAPLVTDGPIILLAFLLTRAVPPTMLHMLALAGGLFVIYTGVGTVRGARTEWQALVTAEGALVATTPWGSFRTAVLACALSPSPYLFWSLVGVPALSAAAEQAGWPAASVMVAGFFTSLLGSKLALGVAAGYGGRFLGSSAHRFLLVGCGMILVGFGLALAFQGGHSLFF